MKFPTHSSILALSAVAFFGVATLDSALASQWLSFLTPDVATTPAVDNAAPVQLAANTRKYSDGSFTGDAFDAYYGMVQVQANIQGGHLVSIDVLQSPNHQRTSRAINRQALPMLESAVIRAQGTRINMVSGATLTSRAYLQSLYGALAQAGS